MNGVGERTGWFGDKFEKKKCRCSWTSLKFIAGLPFLPFLIPRLKGWKVLKTLQSYEMYFIFLKKPYDGITFKGFYSFLAPSLLTLSNNDDGDCGGFAHVNDDCGGVLPNFSFPFPSS